MGKASRGEIIATVIRKEYLTPHLIRIYLTSDKLEQFRETTIGDNNKIFIPPEGVEEVFFPRFDELSRQWQHPSDDKAPIVRTYTHRGIDLSKKELFIDFVHHGENGPASKWAIQARPGAKLGIIMRTQPKVLYPPADWYLLAGDATAIPVLSALLESMPATAKGICILEVHGKEDELHIPTNGTFEFIWLHNAEPERHSRLTQKIREITLPAEGTRFGYIATEYTSVKEIRAYLRKEQNWTSKELYAFSYWKSGEAEDQSREDRKKEKENL